MALDVVTASDQPGSDCWLYRCDERAPFAYARGEEFIRYADDARWARLCDNWLVSERSGARLAYRAGNLFYDAVSHEPLYYQPPFVAPSGHHPSGDQCGAGDARCEPAPHGEPIRHRRCAWRSSPRRTGIGPSWTRGGRW